MNIVERLVPQWEGRDRILLSQGHYAIVFYAALGEAVAGALLERDVRPARFRPAGLPDAFLDSGRPAHAA